MTSRSLLNNGGQYVSTSMERWTRRSTCVRNTSGGALATLNCASSTITKMGVIGTSPGSVSTCTTTRRRGKMHPDDKIRFKHHHVGNNVYVVLEESTGEIMDEDLTYKEALKAAEKRNKDLVQKRING